MKFLKNKFFLAGCLAFCLTTILISCKDKEEVVATGDTLDKLISSNADLSIFQAALVKTRLNIFTQGGGPFTVFAPTNAAFNATGINSVADLALIDSNLLIQVLTYHIQAGKRTYTEIPLGPNATMSTQGGFTQYAARYIGGNAYINGAQIIGTGTNASNGYLYVINKVLTPGFASASVTLGANGNYKRFVQALGKTGVAVTANPLTIFAVPDNIMVAAGYDSTTIANLTVASVPYNALKSIMQYHLVPQRIFTPNFKAGPLKTVQGTNVTIGLGTVVTVKGTNNPAPFNIVMGDFLTSTGVIHEINGLLKP